MKNKLLNIAILGSRGIPNQYGGYETCAEELGIRLAERGHSVSVYCVHHHPLKSKIWNKVNRILITDPVKLGTIGQFIYDLNCNLDSRKKKFDIVLHLGYTSDSIWFWTWPRKSIHFVNMDGLEWRRSKFNPAVRKFLKFAEKLSTLRSKRLIADSKPIEYLLKNKYKNPVSYIAYGAEIPELFDENIPSHFGLEKGRYDLVIARMEPENNIELMIRAKINSNDGLPLIIIGNQNKYRANLEEKFSGEKKVRFLNAIYNKHEINGLRYFSRLYLHGHSVGGTNPSLLEAMACRCNIAAHNNVFNEFILQENASYFSTIEDLTTIFKKNEANKDWISNNLSKIQNEYNWEKITDAYEKMFMDEVSSK